MSFILNPFWLLYMKNGRNAHMVLGNLLQFHHYCILCKFLYLWDYVMLILNYWTNLLLHFVYLSLEEAIYFLKRILRHFSSWYIYEWRKVLPQLTIKEILREVQYPNLAFLCFEHFKFPLLNISCVQYSKLIPPHSHNIVNHLLC